MTVPVTTQHEKVIPIDSFGSTSCGSFQGSFITPDPKAGISARITSEIDSMTMSAPTPE